ncbi:MAG TPA: SGNH/GDSL hydrolase family protein [Gemmatimonadaceae bacterium]|nr:SGNH/GDSL hydrolase family protein [Gemmatimonadaceae bacterium]
MSCAPLARTIQRWRRAGSAAAIDLPSLKRYLALGDSYTIGEGVVEAERWPNQLAGMLRVREIGLEDPLIFARTAWTTDELTDAIDAEKIVGKFDLVTLLIGVNDQYRSRSVQSFAAEFSVLLRRAKAFGGRKASRVIALSIPDWGATPYGEGRDRALIGREIDAYNARAQKLTSAAGARWVDITTITREMQDDERLVASDKLHPSAEMYRQWAELVLPLALEIIGSP